MKNSKILWSSFSLVSVFLSSVAYSKNVDSTWQTSAGGDLATSQNWSLGDMTYWADTQSKDNYVSATFMPISPYDPLVFTASSDLTFANFKLQQNSSYNSQEYIFDIGKDRTIYFNGTSDAGIWVGANFGKRAVVRFKSGNYKKRDGATGNPKFRLTTSSGGCTSIIENASTRMDLRYIDFHPYLGNVLVVTNGAYLSGKLMIAGSGSTLKDGVFLISGSDPITKTPSMFDALNENCYFFDNDNNGGEVTMLVNDGAIVTNFSGAIGNRGSNAKMIVDNGYLYASSTKEKHLTLGGNRTKNSDKTAYIGWPTNNALIVRNGGFLDVPAGNNITVGEHGYDNYMSIESNGKVDVEYLYVGHRDINNNTDEKNYGSKLFVSSGAYLNIFSGLYIRPHSFGHLVDISGEGTRVDIRVDERGVPGHGIYFGGSNCTLRVRDYAVLTNLEMSAGTRFMGNNCRFEVLSHASCFITNGVHLGTSTDKCCVMLVEGGSVDTCERTIDIGTSGTSPDEDMGNMLWVGTDGFVDAYRIRYYGYGNILVVSNGTVNVDEEFRTTYGNTTEWGGRTKVVFAGERPHFVLKGGYCDFQREANVHFDIPSGGYTTIPFEQVGETHFMTIKDCTMSFNLEAYRKSGGGELTLFKSEKEIVISDAQLATFQASTPEGCRIFLSSDRKELKLRVNKRGSIVLIK